jgi:protein-L-isoaspartate(D-aspartate) O-methyltransferase
MQELPRERFLPPEKAELAYLDLDVPLTGAAEGRAARFLLKPMVMAKLIQAAEITASERVLDVGCGTGYAAAIMARLASEVVALDEDKTLAESAKSALAGIANVTVVTGPLVAGWPSGAPFDVIFVEGATEIVPHSLCAQLGEGGRLLCIQGRGPAGKAMLYRSAAGEISGWPIFDAAAPLLPGFAQPPHFVF